MSVLRNRKRGRQKFAYISFNEIKGLDNIKNEEFKSVMENMGMLLYTNGLISVIALIKSKRYNNNRDQTHYFYIYNYFSNWLDNDIHKVIGFEYDINEDLLTKLLEIENARTVLAITKELLLLSDAFKEIVKAEIVETNDTN